jgi:hypothetical protein
MTLRVVDNVTQLDVYNYQDIANCARRFADQLEAGEGPEPSRAILILDTPEGIALCVWGENANGYELLGLLEAAKMHAYEANLGD